MSRKTESITQALDTLDQLDERLKAHNQNARPAGYHPTFEETMEIRELENIEFEMNQQLQLLRMWFQSLYQFNGKSTSRAKQSASRENGKKGGRPTKDISISKSRLLQLEEEIPELSETIKTLENEDEKKEAQKTLRKLKKERTNLTAKLEAAGVKIPV